MSTLPERELDGDEERVQPTHTQYHPFAELGQGGMARVFLAAAVGHAGFNKLVVLKRLRPEHTEDAEFVEMFLDEGRLAARLSHANVVNTYEVGTDHRGHPYIAMEYLAGQPLNRVLMKAHAASAKLNVGMCLRIVTDALGGLHHAHEARDYSGKPLGIIHRDVSPHNIFVTYDGQIKLVDFGIAKAALRTTGATETGVLKGKVNYMSPEQAACAALDRRADVFSMGIVLWELIADRRLMTGDTLEILNRLVRQDPLPRLIETVPGIDAELDAIVMRALEYDPARRYQTALEMREAIERYVRADGVQFESPVGVMESLFKETRDEFQARIERTMTALAAAKSAEEVAQVAKASFHEADETHPVGPTSGSHAAVEVANGAAGRDRRALRIRGLVVSGLVAAACAGGLFFAWRGTRAMPPAEAARPTEAPQSSNPAPSAAGVNASPAPSPPASASNEPTPAVSSAIAVASATAPAPVRRNPHPATTGKPGASHSTTAASSGAAEVATGFLSLDTIPWSAVSEGGRTLGTTPLFRVPLAAGDHVLSLVNIEQGLKKTVTIHVEGGASISQRIKLE